MRWLAPLIVLAAAGCGASLPTGQDANTDVEYALLAETPAHAFTLGVTVEGRIVEKDPWASPEVGVVVGRYQAGVAYYMRPAVALYVSVAPEAGKETARNVAGHEVCHTRTREHNLVHWQCMASIAAPTYPQPNAGAEWLGPAYVKINVGHDLEVE